MHGLAPLALQETPLRTDDKLFAIPAQAVGEDEQKHEDVHALPDSSVKPKTQCRHSAACERFTLSRGMLRLLRA